MTITLDSCDFPVVESEMNGYNVLLLPAELRKLFDEGRVDAVHIKSLKIAEAIPDYGGKTSGSFSLLPHQDHIGSKHDPRRFLCLSKLSHGVRGASTVLMTNAVAATLLPIEEQYFAIHRVAIGRERQYDPRFFISEAQYDRCYEEPDGYRKVLAELIDAGGDAFQLRLGIMCYLVRGPTANVMMDGLLARGAGMILEERWETGGVLIVDNERLCHGRRGRNNPPLKRNYFH